MSDDDSSTTASTPWPIFAALAIIVLVLLGIGGITLANRGGDRQEEAVVRAAIGQNDALQRLDYPAYRANTCLRLVGTEADVLDRQRDSVADKGARYVENVTKVAIEGDTATATVSYYFAKDRDDKVDTATTFVREDGTWRVCS